MKITYKNTLAAVGALLTAVLASTCCIGPFLAIAGFLGVSISQLVWLASIKNYLIIISLSAIVYSLYKAYKEPKNMELSCCTVDLENSQNEKADVKRAFRSKLFLWIMAFLTLATLLAPYAATAQQPAVKVARATYKVEKLTQECCVGIIEYSLKDLKGFKKLTAAIKAREIVVWYNPKETNKIKIKEAIDKSGYIAIIKE